MPKTVLFFVALLAAGLNMVFPLVGTLGLLWLAYTIDEIKWLK